MQGRLQRDRSTNGSLSIIHEHNAGLFPPKGRAANLRKQGAHALLCNRVIRTNEKQFTAGAF